MVRIRLGPEDVAVNDLIPLGELLQGSRHVGHLPFHRGQLRLEEFNLALLAADLRALEVLVENEDGAHDHGGKEDGARHEPTDVIRGGERHGLRAELCLIEPDVMFPHGKKSGAKVRESPYFHNRKPATDAAFTEFTTNTGV